MYVLVHSFRFSARFASYLYFLKFVSDQIFASQYCVALRFTRVMYVHVHSPS